MNQYLPTSGGSNRHEQGGQPEMGLTEDAQSVPSARLPIRRRNWFVPVVILVVATILGALRLTESSVALYETDTQDTGVIVGRARPIRSDEWWVRLSTVVRQDETDYPGSSQIGMGTHDTGTVLNIPAKNLDVLVRPQSLLYFIFPIEIAYALEWWYILALPIIGFFLIFRHFGLREMPAVLCASIFSLSPLTHWWTMPDHGIIAGYASIGTALLLSTLAEERTKQRMIRSVLGGWLFACAAASLYPPHLIPVFLLMIGVFVAAVFMSRERWPSLRRQALWSAGAAILTGGLLVCVYFLRHRVALTAINSTVYPGRRSVNGGGGSLVSLLAAPYNRAVATPLNPVVSGLNVSEFSSGLFLWWPALCVAIVTSRNASRRSPWLVVAALTSLVGIFVAWFALPMPKFIGQFLLLDRVPGHRMIFSIAVGGALAFGLALRVLQSTPLRRSEIAGIAASFYVLTLLAGTQIFLDGVPLSDGAIFLMPIPITLGIALALGRRAAVGLGIVVAYLAFATAYVNPLQFGLDPLLSHPVRTALIQLHEENPDATALLMDLDVTNIGAADASGIPVVGGANFYPDAEAWEVFDPDREQEDVWNRYATLLVTRGSDQPTGTMTLVQADVILLALSPCDERLERFNVQFVVTQGTLNESCVSALEQFESGNSVVTIYEIHQP